MKRQHWITTLVTIALVATAGAGFQQYRIESLRQQMTREVLRADWNTALFLVTFENARPVWFYDHVNPTETQAVARVQRFHQITDSTGAVISQSKAFSGVPAVTKDGFDELSVQGRRYLTYSAAIQHRPGKVYRLTLARSAAGD
jgi:hypothetical protein